MPKYEILSETRAERHPNATTGDAVARTKQVVEWDEQPLPQQMAGFVAQNPIHLYDTFHFVKGCGKVS
jgi:hypothetical protein